MSYSNPQKSTIKNRLQQTYHLKQSLLNADGLSNKTRNKVNITLFSYIVRMNYILLFFFDLFLKIKAIDDVTFKQDILLT